MSNDPAGGAEPGFLRVYGPALALPIIVVGVLLGYWAWKYWFAPVPVEFVTSASAESTLSPPAGRIATCPRVNPPYADAGEAKANSDEQRIRALRRLAWQDDFFAQITLADIYRAANSLDQNYEDTQEAAVWLTAALANPQGYQPMDRAGINSCRAAERANADAVLSAIISRMAAEDIAAVRDRVVYIFASQGAPGLMKLARLYDDGGYDVYGAPWSDRLPRRRDDRRRPRDQQHETLFAPRPVDAWMFYFLAAQQGDPMAGLALGEFESRARGDFRSYATEKAFRWTAPFEFYPPQSLSRSGIPLSDDSYCDPMGSVSLIVRQVPFTVTLEALNDLNYLSAPSRPARGLIPIAHGVPLRPDVHVAAARFQAAIREHADGELTPAQTLRLVQLAAEHGSPRAQTALAVMYAKGVGTCHGQDYARAYYWFRRAADQGGPSAIYALSRYFDEGVGGVAPQDTAHSVTLAVASARAGFWPTRDELASLMAQAKKEARDP